jgi:hypothetical protein
MLAAVPSEAGLAPPTILGTGISLGEGLILADEKQENPKP